MVKLTKTICAEVTRKKPQIPKSIFCEEVEENSFWRDDCRQEVNSAISDSMVKLNGTGNIFVAIP